jgi:hypothetical protein
MTLKIAAFNDDGAVSLEKLLRGALIAKDIRERGDSSSRQILRLEKAVRPR